VPSPMLVPRIVILPLMYACDAKCVMCNIWERADGTSWGPDVVRRVFSHPEMANNVEVVNVTGGEASMRRDLPDVIRALIESTKTLHTISLQTNAMNPDRLEKRISAIVDIFQESWENGRSLHFDVNISLDGPRPVHDEIRGVPGAFDCVMDSLERLRGLLSLLPRSALAFNCTVVRQNIMHLRETQSVADELGIEITFTIPQHTDVYMENAATTNRFAFSESECHEIIAFLRERQEQANGRSAMSRRYCSMLISLLENGKRGISCPLSEGGLFLEPDGRSLPCWNSSKLATGNILKEGVEAVLTRRAEPEYREQLAQHCQTCSINCYVDWTRRMFARGFSQGTRTS
jgi:MoaA/NifB/PqqE/SkfB family radical SAM enzyme